MILIIDSGNTTTKIGEFNNGKINKIIEKKTLAEISETINFIRPHQIIIGSVKFQADELLSCIDIPTFVITHLTPFPFEIDYKTPETLGIDRIAGVAGAWNKYKDQNILIIDAGTCITYDFISYKGEYKGGGISPGIDIKLKALHKFTANLPDIAFDPNIELVGDTTRSSILSGVINGTIAEIDGIIKRYQENYENLTIIMSGGYSFFFESKLKHSIFALPNLVLWGLYSIYHYNVREISS